MQRRSSVRGSWGPHCWHCCLPAAGAAQPLALPRQVRREIGGVGGALRSFHTPRTLCPRHWNAPHGTGGYSPAVVLYEESGIMGSEVGGNDELCRFAARCLSHRSRAGSHTLSCTGSRGELALRPRPFVALDQIGTWGESASKVGHGSVDSGAGRVRAGGVGRIWRSASQAHVAHHYRRVLCRLLSPDWIVLAPVVCLRSSHQRSDLCGACVGAVALSSDDWLVEGFGSASHDVVAHWPEQPRVVAGLSAHPGDPSQTRCQSPRRAGSGKE
jgi:hypothetical protein